MDVLLPGIWPGRSVPIVVALMFLRTYHAAGGSHEAKFSWKAVSVIRLNLPLG